MPRNFKIGTEPAPAANCPQRAVCDQLRRQALVRQLQQAQQMASVSAIAAGLAHDFKNLMTTISLHSDLIGMSLPPDAAQQQNLAYVRQAVRQSKELLDSLVTVVRPLKGRPVWLRVEEEIAAMDCLIRGVAGPQVDIALQLDAAAPVRIDRSSLRQIVLNCVSNATDAMKGRGSLQIRVRPIQLSHAPAAEFDPPMSAGEYAEVSIKDTGPGIDHLILRRGGVMRRRHASESGWGIGLTVIQACAVRANGSVKITSEEGRGTCVKIVLPVASTRRRHNSKASVVKCS